VKMHANRQPPGQRQFHHPEPEEIHHRRRQRVARPRTDMMNSTMPSKVDGISDGVTLRLRNLHVTANGSKIRSKTGPRELNRASHPLHCDRSRRSVLGV
jgi:hypothetical protein